MIYSEFSSYEEAEIAELKSSIANLEEQLTAAMIGADRYRYLRDWAQANQMALWFAEGMSLAEIDAEIDRRLALVKGFKPRPRAQLRED